jgi:hypothetical protein
MHTTLDGEPIRYLRSIDELCYVDLFDWLTGLPKQTVIGFFIGDIFANPTRMRTFVRIIGL